MRIITLTFTAAVDGSPLSFDRDSVISYVSGTKNSVISTDPAATIANRITAPAVKSQLNDTIAVINSTVGFQLKTDFPVSAGESVFVSFAGAGSIQLFMTDPS